MLLGKGIEGAKEKEDEWKVGKSRQPIQVSSGENSWASTPESEEIEDDNNAPKPAMNLPLVGQRSANVSKPASGATVEIAQELQASAGYEDSLLTLDLGDIMNPSSKFSRLTDKQIEAKLSNLERKALEDQKAKKSGKPLGKYPQRNKKFILQTVCYDFQNKGGCKRGDRCNYSHVPADKTVCLDWREAGFCERGDECRYAHKLGEGIYDFANSSFAVRQRQTQIQETLNTILATDKPDIPSIKMMKLMVPPDTKDQEIALEKGISVVLNK